MIIEQLMVYIQRVCPPERVDAYKELIPFLMELNPSLMEFNLMQFCASIDEETSADNRDQFDNFLIQVVTEGIEEFGVYLNDEGDFRGGLFLLGKVLKSLYRLDQYEDIQQLNDILTAGENAKETIVDMLVAVSPEINGDEVMVFIAEISGSLIRRIKELLEDLSYQFDEQTPAADSLLIERVKLALSSLKIESARKYFINGGCLGEDVDNYLDYYISGLKDATPETIAKFALFSGVAADLNPETLREEITSKMEYYFPVAATLLKVTRAIGKTALPEFVYA